MITLLLLHPLKRNPVQSWSFENESVIRIGRSTDNHVILYSAVVSRHHVELRQTGSSWEIVNLGTNGTYLDGKRITKVPVVDGAIIRLARSGPNIQIRLGTEALKELPDHLSSEALIGQRIDHHATVTDITEGGQKYRERPSTTQRRDGGDDDPPTGMIPVPPHLRIPEDGDTSDSSSNDDVFIRRSPLSKTSPDLAAHVPHAASWEVSTPSTPQSQGPDAPFQPVEAPNPALESVGSYNVLKVLGQGDVGMTYLAERDGQRLVLKTMNADWLSHPKAKAALEMEADLLGQLDSPYIPRVIDFFVERDRPYLVMEKIDGMPLSQTVKIHGVFSLPQAIAKMLKICDVLSYLHQFVPPVLHRNIEPSNLICRNASDDLALISFGAVKSMVLERKGYVGSHGCVAPDQLLISATPQVDLYGLAPTLAYLLTGKNPVTFCQRTGPTRYQFMADAMTGFSDRILTIMRRLTHVDAQYHYPSVEAVSDAFRALRAT